MPKNNDKDSAGKFVIEYLKKNKNFFLYCPELLDALNFPTKTKSSEKIIDLNAYRSKKIINAILRPKRDRKSRRNKKNKAKK